MLRVDQDNLEINPVLLLAGETKDKFLGPHRCRNLAEHRVLRGMVAFTGTIIR